MTVEIYALEPRAMEAFLERRRAALAFPQEMNLADNLAEILRKANEFVPSAAGSILLDNPLEKLRSRRCPSLTFVAAFGDEAEQLIGRQIAADQGIAGRVYGTGEPYRVSQASGDDFFFAGVDEETQYRTQSLVAIPICIEKEVCGVLELINRQGASAFSDQDRNLLQIFAGYTAVSIQNILDGRRAQELAKRDNLTGLFNDHFLHVALTRAVERCRRDDHDMAVIFLDLDYFKQVNDSHGHLAGSQVLREIGHLLKAQMAATAGGIPARYGGDEFVLVIPNVGLDQAVDFAEQVRERVNAQVFCQAPGDLMPEVLSLTGITCSIGVASLLEHVEPGRSTESAKSTLLRLADTAMYVAKETGRNRTAIAGKPIRRRAASQARPRS